MTMMIEDLASAAFDAARDHEQDTVSGLVDQLLLHGTGAVDSAMTWWMDRALVVMYPHPDLGVELRVELESEHSDGGEPTPADQLPADVAWTGEMFLAYCTRSADAWRALWQQVPDAATGVYVRRMLTTMAKTALAYEEEAPESVTCCQFHRRVIPDLAVTAARMAKAHLN